MATLKVNLVTPDKDLMHGEVDQVTAPSIMGEVGILPDHLPLLAELVEGPVGLYKAGVAQHFAVSGGFIEVNNNVVTILAETAEKASNIDKKRSEKALHDAEAQMKKLDPLSEEYGEQAARAKRARVRLLVGG